MRPPRSISVLVPTLDAGELLGRQLAALAAQSCPVPWDFLAVDSGSRDGTRERLEAWCASAPVPARCLGIHPAEFDHGDTRNLLAARSEGELLVFLTQDAIPGGPDWLARLAANFDDPAVAAAYGRNLPRPEADLLTRVFSAGDPGYVPGRREVRLPEDRAEYEALDPHERRLLYNFNDVASAVRRDLWERHPFPRTDFGEDLLMARALLEAGFTVVYDEDARVEHSHDWGPDELRARARVDARFNAEHLGRVCVASRSDAAALVERQLVTDRAALVEAGLAGVDLERELERARELRRATFEGLHEGGLTDRRRPATALSTGGPLAVLFVVHGFPPDTWAGTEVYTLELARQLARRGHRVSVLARAPLAPGDEPWRIRAEDFDGLRVLRVPTDIDYKRVRASYASERAERLFRDLLERERPDVVHFQHLLHLSAALPAVARAAGVPSVLTCNDYWGLCARVQLIRPDGRRCEENQGLGCFWCLKNKAPARVEAARRWLGAAAPVAAVARAGLERLGVDLDRPIPNPGPPGSKLARRMVDFEGVRTRQDFVLSGYAAADLLVAPSRFLREKYLASGAFDPECFVYSDYGMRPVSGAGSSGAVREGSRGPRTRGPLRVGFVGSLVWYKGVDVLLEAFLRLEPGLAELAVHGAFDPEGDAHHAELARLAGPAVTFHGRFENRRLGEIHAGLDVLVVPSVWFENSPITIHEAFQYGTPLVTSDIGGMAELVESGGGLAFRAGDPGDLARVLGELAREPDRLDELRRGAPPVKSIEDDARDFEYRYRQLVCLRLGGGRVER